MSSPARSPGELAEFFRFRRSKLAINGAINRAIKSAKRAKRIWLALLAAGFPFFESFGFVTQCSRAGPLSL
jgi:hypothetical protein